MFLIGQINAIFNVKFSHSCDRMAWQPWSAGAPGVLPGLAGLAAVVNPAPAVLPTGSQYSAEQWAQMQQQNWQQWAQWQQQYQQWHQQYGAEVSSHFEAFGFVKLTIIKDVCVSRCYTIQILVVKLAL